MKRIAPIVLACIISLQNFSVAAQAAEPVEGSKTYLDMYDFNFTDTNSMTDEEFFGVYNAKAEQYEIAPKLNYSFSEQLAIVESYVKLGNYTAAKEALFEYYRDRDFIKRPDLVTERNPLSAFLAENQIYVFSERPIDVFNVNSQEFDEYEIEVTSDLQSAAGAFLLMGFDKSDSIAEFKSRESDLPPLLEVTMKSGQKYTLTPVKDTYIRAYDPDNKSYRDMNYGTEETMLVKDSYYINGDDASTALPFDSNTRKAFLSFDVSAIDMTQMKDARLKLYGRLIPEEDGSGAFETSKPIILLRSYNKVWAESEIDARPGILKLTWNNITHCSYSYKDVPGLFTWKKPEGAHAEFIHANNRLYELSPLVHEYLYSRDLSHLNIAIFQTLDYIRDGVRGVQEGSEIGASNRPIEICASYFYFFDSPDFTPDANCAILKYLWEEANFFTTGVMYQPENNRGIWQVNGFNSIATYFPEYVDSPVWRTMVDDKLYECMDKLILEDGSYNEPTFGYPVNVVGWLIKICKDFKNAHMEVPEYLENKILKLTRYLMDNAYPSGVPPYRGEGGPSDVRSLCLQVGQMFSDDELIYFGSGGKSGTKPKETAVLYNKTKVFASRTNYSSNAAMFWMNALNGGNHGHRDSLHVNFFYEGVELISDTGMTSYDGAHPHYDWQRHQTKSHNTIEINDSAQRGAINVEENGESDIKAISNDYFDFVTAFTDANEGFRHHREVLFVKNLEYLIVADYIESDEGYNKYNQTWHLRPYSGITIDPTTKKAQSHFATTANVQIVPSDPENITATLADGYHYIRHAETKYPSYVKNKIGDVSYETVIYPVSAGEYKDVRVTRIDTGKDPAIASALKINTSYGEYDTPQYFYISHEDTPQSRSFAEFSFDGKSFLIQEDSKNNITGITSYGFSELERNGKVLVKSNEKIKDLSVLYSGNKMEIFSNDIGEDYSLTIFSQQELAQVILNGEIVNFYQLGNQVYVNSRNELYFDVVQNPATLKYEATLPKLNFGFSVEIDSEKYDVTLQVPENTVISSDKPWDGYISYPSVELILGGSASWAKKDYIKIAFGTNNFTLNKEMTVIVEAHGDKGIHMLLGDQITSAGNIRVQKQRNDLKFTTYKLGTYLIDMPPSVPGESGAGFPAPGASVKPHSGTGGGGGAAAPPNTAPAEQEQQVEQPKEKTVFDDIKSHWARAEILKAYDLGIVKGKTEDSFFPDDEITRAEFMALIVRAFFSDTSPYRPGTFKDVDSGKWYADIIQTCFDNGIISGNDGFALPESPILRAEMSKIAVLAMERIKGSALEKGGANPFSDVANEWFYEYVLAAYHNGIIKGMSEDLFEPFYKTTRAQAVVVLLRLMELN